MSHKVAKKIRRLLNTDEMYKRADDVVYRAITHVKLSKNGTRYERYQIVLADNCGRAWYQRWKKKFKKR